MGEGEEKRVGPEVPAGFGSRGAGDAPCQPELPVRIWASSRIRCPPCRPPRTARFHTDTCPGGCISPQKGKEREREEEKPTVRFTLRPLGNGHRDSTRLSVAALISLALCNAEPRDGERLQPRRSLLRGFLWSAKPDVKLQHVELERATCPISTGQRFSSPQSCFSAEPVSPLPTALGVGSASSEPALETRGWVRITGILKPILTRTVLS